MGLFGRGTSLTLETDAARVAPGDVIRARVTVGEPDKKARGGRLTLLYTNTYQYESRDSDGDRTSTTTRKDVVVAQEPLFGGGPATAGTYDVELRVPDGAPPSAPRSVDYELKATIDRAGARDVNEELELQVLSAPDAYADRASRPVEQPDELTADIAAAPRELSPGEEVSGTVTVTAPSDLEGRALRARVRGVRRDQDGLTKDHAGEPQTLTEPAALVAGVPQTFAFAVRVPADAVPTFEAEHNELDWFLEVSLDRKLRKDPTARLPLVVRSR